MSPRALWLCCPRCSRGGPPEERALQLDNSAHHIPPTIGRRGDLPPANEDVPTFPRKSVEPLQFRNRNDGL